MKDDKQLELELPRREARRDSPRGHTLQCVLVASTQLLIALPSALQSGLVEMLNYAVTLPSQLP